MSTQVLEKNKVELKKKIIFDIVKACTLVALAFMLFFLPIFRIEEETWLGTLTYDFSIYDEIQMAFEAFDAGGMAYAIAIFPLFILITSVVVLIMAIVEFVKKLMQLTSFNDSVLQTYDDIVNQPEKRSWKKAQSQQMIWSVIALIIVYIIEAKVFGKMFGEIDSITGEVDEMFYTINMFYMPQVTGVAAGSLVVVILVLAAFITMNVLSNSITKKVRREHLSEKYEQEKVAVAPATATSTATPAAVPQAGSYDPQTGAFIPAKPQTSGYYDPQTGVFIPAKGSFDPQTGAFIPADEQKSDE